MKKRVLTAAAAVSVAALIVGCSSGGGGNGGGDAPQGEYAENGTFTLALTNDLGGMNPYLERQNFGYGLSAYLYDPLVNFDPETGEISSGIASEWETEPDKITLTIRDDITCSSGEQITPEYVKELIEWNSDPANGSSMYSVYTSNVPSTVTVDGDKVIVQYEAPDGLALERLGSLPIVCSEGFADPSILATQSDGTGPYVLESAQAGDRYTLVRRDGYNWGPGGVTNTEPGMPEKVVLRIISDETTRANLLLSGEINAARIAGPDRARLDAQNMHYVDELNGAAWLNFNEFPDRVTSEKAVREAMFQAIDIQEVIQISTSGRGEEATSLTVLAPQVCAAQDPISTLVPGTDVEGAKATLEAAGWIEGANGVREKDGKRLTVNVSFNNSLEPENPPTAEYFADRWEAVGFDVELDGGDQAYGYQKLLVTADFDVSLGYSSFYLPSAQVDFLSGRTPLDDPSGMNSGFHDNPVYHENKDIALGLTPPEACDYWIAAEQAMISELEWVPISNRYVGWYFNKAEGEIGAYSRVVPSSLRLFQ